MKSVLILGKRYEWYINNIDDRKKDGLFTGEFYKNGNAKLLTRNGEEWSIPVEDLKLK
jgi:hypothetical protein